MVEQKKTDDIQKEEEETKKEQTKTPNGNTDNGVPKEKEISPLEEAKRFNKETKKMLAEMKEERTKIETAAAEMLVNGRSLAGQVKKAETENEKWAREAKARYAGTGLDPTI